MASSTSILTVLGSNLELWGKFLLKLNVNWQNNNEGRLLRNLHLHATNTFSSNEFAKQCFAKFVGRALLKKFLPTTLSLDVWQPPPSTPKSQIIRVWKFLIFGHNSDTLVKKYIIHTNWKIWSHHSSKNWLLFD